tara:strand:+ start:1186 stop:1419 length:234 start_codon:yes stop_codon:yes gene_type:complete
MTFYLGKKNIRACSSCLATFSQQVEAYIRRANAYWLTGHSYRVICKTCAKKDFSKHPARWHAIHDKVLTLPEELDIV